MLESGNGEEGHIQYTGQDVGLISSKDGNDKTSSSLQDGLDLRRKDGVLGHPRILLIFTRIRNTGGER